MPTFKTLSVAIALAALLLFPCVQGRATQSPATPHGALHPAPSAPPSAQQDLTARTAELKAELDALEQRLNELPRKLDGSWSTQLEQSGKMVEAILANEGNRLNLMLVILGILGLIATGGGVFTYMRFCALKAQMKNEVEGARQHCSEVKSSSDEAMRIAHVAQKTLVQINAACMRAAKAAQDACSLCDNARNSSQKIDELLAGATDAQKKLDLTPKDKAEAKAIACDESQPLVVRLKARAILSEETQDWANASRLWSLVVQELPLNAPARHRLVYCLGMRLKSQNDPSERPDIVNRMIDQSQFLIELSDAKHVAYSNWGAALAELAKLSTDKNEQAKRLALACEKCEAATTHRPNFAEAFSNWGLALANWAIVSPAEEQAERFALACEKYKAATTHRPDSAEAFFNWGLALTDWAMVSTGKEQAERFALACEKYKTATTHRPNFAEAFSNWGATLSDWAKLSTGTEQTERFKSACEKYAAATTHRPNYATAYFNWGNALMDWAKLSTDKNEQTERFKSACGKFKEATTHRPDFAEAFSNWGTTLADWAKLSTGKEQAERFALACKKYETATRLLSNFAEAFFNWGAALANWATVSPAEKQAERFALACEKYKAATTHRPNCAEAFSNWGNALANWAKLSTIEEERQRLFDEVEQRLAQAEAITPGMGAYNRACVAAMRGQGEDCRRWLERNFELKATPPAERLATDSDLDSVRGEQWFKDLVAKRRRIEGADNENIGEKQS
ncbi:cellobiose-specific phosphotransferase system component IIA [Desulfobaculum xiamenense]|uniref:Cellobiose-specific phosphotransferase system component IIA n=1 Tax=Desulfobaculum xiamenense TaxID=995050 RepID=A0A846QIY0_9BACT|nr:hypothetical protein [Desulfobaculum xiamenense]NJB66422.1 cellobiose-specific phosphotransferase system component IIA [Desulfobaculum xiamenense]